MHEQVKDPQADVMDSSTQVVINEVERPTRLTPAEYAAQVREYRETLEAQLPNFRSSSTGAMEKLCDDLYAHDSSPPTRFWQASPYQSLMSAI